MAVNTDESSPAAVASPQPSGASPDAPWVAIAANRYSGRGDNVQRVEALARQLEKVGLASRVMWDSAEYANLADPQTMAGCHAVVCGGGDGSLNRIINHKPLAPVTVLPIGNENLFARYFGLTTDPVQLADVISQHHLATLDLGSANGQLFTLMVSVGLDSEVVRRVTDWRESATGLRRVTRTSYTLPVLKSVTRYGFPPITLEADGQSITGSHVFVFNMPCYGFNLPFSPQAQPDDGMLDWIVFEKPGRLRSLRYAWQVFRNKHHEKPGVRIGRCNKLTLSADQPIHAQADGDLIDTLPMTIEVQPGAMRFIVPGETKN